MPLKPNSQVGPYEIVAPIGAGGMGEVYRARDPRIKRDVAIKILPPGFASNPERLRRFEQEARTIGSLNHPNLLVIFDIGNHEGSPYLVTELLEGETLRERLLRDSIPLRKAIDWTNQISEAVAAAHEKGVIHRDIKPENIYLTRDERVKLLDFGLAKLVVAEGPPSDDASTRVRNTGAGVIPGTPGYMSPEQVRGEQIDERSDIFALGIVLVEMVTGAHPFHQATRVETMNAILHKDVHLPETVQPGLARIIDHMLSKSSLSRFQSMKDVAFALQLLSGSGISGETSQTAIGSRTADAGKPHDFLRLSSRRGRIGTARFTPDGSVVYGAAWEGAPLEIFLSHPGEPEALPIGLADADVLSVSAAGELAVSVGRRFLAGWVSTGTLARMRMAGGAPRRICENVVDADWAPDGKDFAIARLAGGGRFTLEYPIGRELRVAAGWISHVRFSRDGTRIGFMEHQWFGDDGGRPVVIDLEGHTIMKAPEYIDSTEGLVWSPDGNEIWIGAVRGNLGRDIVGFDMSGNSHVVLTSPGDMTIYDVNVDGDVIVTHDNWRREVYAARRGERAERNLAWFEWPMLCALSADGSEILFEEQRAIATEGAARPVFLRPVDGGPAVHIADGRARALSPDGNWVAVDSRVTGQLELIPTGVGKSKLINCGEFEEMFWWFWFPDGKRLLVLGYRADKSPMASCVSIDGGDPTPAGPGNVAYPVAISPDGERFVCPGPDERLVIYPVSGSEGIPVPGTEPGEWPIAWCNDGKAIFVVPRGKTTLMIERIDIETGERSDWQMLKPADPAGIVDIFPVYLTPDGEQYAYSYRRCLSDLYLVSATAR